MGGGPVDAVVYRLSPASSFDSVRTPSPRPHRWDTFDDYSKYWGLFGTIVGVVTGAIPSFFFKSQADQATERAEKEAERAAKESTKAQWYAGAADPTRIEEMVAADPGLFS